MRGHKKGGRTKRQNSSKGLSTHYNDVRRLGNGIGLGVSARPFGQQSQSGDNEEVLKCCLMLVEDTYVSNIHIILFHHPPTHVRDEVEEEGAIMHVESGWCLTRGHRLPFTRVQLNTWESGSQFNPLHNVHPPSTVSHSAQSVTLKVAKRVERGHRKETMRRDAEGPCESMPVY